MNATPSANGNTRKPRQRTSSAISGIMKSTAASFVRKMVTSAATQRIAKYKRRSEPRAARAANSASHEKIDACSAAATIVTRPRKKRSTSHSAQTIDAALAGVRIPQSNISAAPPRAACHSGMRPARKTSAPIVSAKIRIARVSCTAFTRCDAPDASRVWDTHTGRAERSCAEWLAPPASSLQRRPSATRSCCSRCANRRRAVYPPVLSCPTAVR